MKFRILILTILLAIVFAQSAEAQHGRRQANTTPEPTPTTNTQALHSVQIRITASESWTYPQSGVGCRLDVLASEQRLAVVTEDGFSTEIRIPNGTQTRDNGCEILIEADIPQSPSYEVFFRDESVGDVDGLAVQGNGGVEITLEDQDFAITSSTPVPTPQPTTVPTPAPTEQPAGHIRGDQYLLRGYLDLHTDNVTVTGDSCSGTRGYSDIGTGTQVVVRDGTNNVLGTGRLEYSEEFSSWPGCAFVFEVEVPETSFYQIEMSHRGQMIYSFDDLEEDLWTVFLVLGR